MSFGSYLSTAAAWQTKLLVPVQRVAPKHACTGCAIVSGSAVGPLYITKQARVTESAAVDHSRCEVEPLTFDMYVCADLSRHI